MKHRFIRMMLCAFLGIFVLTTIYSAAWFSRDLDGPQLPPDKVYEDLHYDESIPEGLEIDHSFSTALLLNYRTLEYQYLIEKDGTRIPDKTIYKNFHYIEKEENYLRDYGFIKTEYADGHEEYKYEYYLYDDQDVLIQDNVLDETSYGSCNPCRVYAYDGEDYTVTEYNAMDLSAKVFSYVGGKLRSCIDVIGKDEPTSRITKYEYEDGNLSAELIPSPLRDSTTLTSYYTNYLSSEKLLEKAVLTYHEDDDSGIASVTTDYEYYPNGVIFRKMITTEYTDGTGQFTVIVYQYGDYDEAMIEVEENAGGAEGVLTISSTDDIVYYSSPSLASRLTADRDEKGLTVLVYEKKPFDNAAWYRISNSWESPVWIFQDNADDSFYFSFREGRDR